VTVVYDRPVRFEDVDPAGIVFFPRFLSYCHEAMETFFAALPGGYAALITQRRIGFPAVHLEVDFKSPLRYGDVARIAIDVPHVGNRSATLRYTLTRAADGHAIALVTHICAIAALDVLKAIAIPDDIRAVLEAHKA